MIYDIHFLILYTQSGNPANLLEYIAERGPDSAYAVHWAKNALYLRVTCTISEGLDIPMVVMLFICYVMIWSCKYYYYTITINSINTAPHNDIYIHLSDIARILGFWAKTHYIGSTHYFERTISGAVLYYFVVICFSCCVRARRDIEDK